MRTAKAALALFFAATTISLAADPRKNRNTSPEQAANTESMTGCLDQRGEG